LRISRPTVQLWRQRFLALRAAGLEKDAPRPGRIPRISSSEVAAFVEATLHRKPPNATHWSTRTMAKAQGVSEATVRRIWQRDNLKPHCLETTADLELRRNCISAAYPVAPGSCLCRRSRGMFHG